MLNNDATSRVRATNFWPDDAEARQREVELQLACSTNKSVECQMPRPTTIGSNAIRGHLLRRRKKVHRAAAIAVDT